VALRCAAPIASPALTVNRLCGSGFETVIQGAEVNVFFYYCLLFYCYKDNCLGAILMSRYSRYSLLTNVTQEQLLL
jgi:hypothetical protein